MQALSILLTVSALLLSGIAAALLVTNEVVIDVSSATELSNAVDTLALLGTNPEGPRRPAVVRLRAGRFQLHRPLVLDQRHRHIHFVSSGGKASISGGRPVTGFKTCDFNSALICADVSDFGDLVQARHLYRNGVRVPRAPAPTPLLASFVLPLAADPTKYQVATSAIHSWLNMTAKDIGEIEFVFGNSQPSPWTESRCTVDNITREASSVFVYMKQPCFKRLYNKPCGQGWHTPSRIESAALSDLELVALL